LRKILVWLIGVGLVFQLSSCSGPEQGPSIDILRIGILPDEGEQTLRKRYIPLFDFLSQETGRPYELFMPNSYDELVRVFGEGQVDLAYFGGATFLKANSEYDAMPLVMRDVDSRFTSTLVVAGEGFKNFEELQCKRFGFGSKLSTSGHLMPRHFLQLERGVTPEKYFHSIRYSGKHDRTAYWVRDGEVDAGFVNSEIIRGMFADGRLQAGDIRALWTTPPFADYVWATHPRVHPVDREKLQRAFLLLSADNPQHKIILSNISAAGFYPASISDFSRLQQIMTDLGVL
jgi:phosphonate transport system substrate-binding protein